MDKKRKKITWLRWSIRTVAITASTLAAVALIKGEVYVGFFLGFSWLAIVLSEKKIFNNDLEPMEEE